MHNLHCVVNVTLNLATKALSETKNLMDKNSVNGIVDFRALNQSL
ncbi:hypothetical protein [Campylobacter hyointestinalis]|nr:hypothetical protein [Campylobacter hyointestinalis]